MGRNWMSGHCFEDFCVLIRIFDTKTAYEDQNGGKSGPNGGNNKKKIGGRKSLYITPDIPPLAAVTNIYGHVMALGCCE